MQVIDVNQKWIQKLPGHAISELETTEARAIEAKESGIPFYSLEFSSYFRDLDTTLAVFTQVGWELVTVLSTATNTVTVLFKQGNSA